MFNYLKDFWRECIRGISKTSVWILDGIFCNRQELLAVDCYCKVFYFKYFQEPFSVIRFCRLIRKIKLQQNNNQCLHYFKDFCKLWKVKPMKAGHKLNVNKNIQKTSKTSSERVMCIQFTSCVFAKLSI